MAETALLPPINDFKILPGELDDHKEKNEDKELTTFKVYKKRWFILFLLFFYAFANLMQAYGYAVIADLLVQYYEVSYTLAEWSTTFGLILHAITLIPGSYLLDKLGLRNCVLVGVIGTAVGSWIKVFSIEQSRFWVFFAGKAVVSLFQVFVAAIPTKLAAVWFGSDQVSSACFIALIELEFSYTLGMFTMSKIVQPGTIEEIGTGLQNLAYFTAIYPTVLTPILLLFFTNAPPTPPSLAQITTEKEKTKSILKSLKIFVTNRSFMLFLPSYGITTGILQATYINSSQMFAYYYPNDTSRLGTIMTLCTVGGMIGALILGKVLDRYRCFKKATIVLFVLVTICSIIHITTMMLFDVRILYGTSFLLGFVALPMYSVGYSVGIELTYPEAECVCGTILQVAIYAFSLPITHLHSYLFTAIGATWANIVLYFITIFGNLLLIGVRFDLRRQMVETTSKVEI